MNPASPHWKTILSRRPFRLAWVVLAVGLIALIVGAFFLPFRGFAIEMFSVAVVVALSFAAVYGAAKDEWTSALERNELGGLLEALDDALLIYDENFTVVLFNVAAEKMFDLKAPDAVGHRLSPRDIEHDTWRTIAQVVFPSLAPQVIALSPEGKYPVIAEVSFSDPEREFRVTTAPVSDENGRNLAFLKIIRDLTPERAALKAKDDFITVASHQLRGPVTDINWALESLASTAGLSESDKVIVDNAAAASRGLLRRVEDFLDLSRMEEGRLTYSFEAADIVGFLQKTLGEVMPAARTAGIKLYFDHPGGALPPVAIDQKQISTVVVNLIENAIRYNVENGEVIVKAEMVPDKPFIEVSVHDTGIGIPPEALPKLFSKFYRAENAVKSQTEGSGIGLYVARGIIRAHGGEIWVESELGRGTTVHFTVPIAPEKELEDENAPAELENS